MALVIAAAPVAPLMVVGPAAVSVKSVARAVPPFELTTFFTKVSCGEISVLLMVQVADCPIAKDRLLPDSVPAEQDHAPAP